MNIPTALETSAIAKSNRDKLIPNLINVVKEQISEAADRGKNDCIFRLSNFEFVHHIFKEAGYTIYADPFTSVVRIKWPAT